MTNAPFFPQNTSNRGPTHAIDASEPPYARLLAPVASELEENPPTTTPEKKRGRACRICGKTFSRDRDTSRHEKMHAKTGVNERPFVCSHAHCGRTFTLQYSLKRHLQNVHPNPPPTTPEKKLARACRICGKTFSRDRDTSRHEKTHAKTGVNGRPFVCSHAHCGRTFTLKHSLKRHLQNVHPPTKKRKDDHSDQAAPYPRLFIRIPARAAHPGLSIRIPLSSPPFLSSAPSSASSPAPLSDGFIPLSPTPTPAPYSPPILDADLTAISPPSPLTPLALLASSRSSSPFSPTQIDSNPLTHTCLICNKSFDGNSRLKRHQLVHSGDKPFLCTHRGCGRAFNQRPNMLRHVQTVHRPGRGISMKVAAQGKRVRANRLSLSIATPDGESPPALFQFETSSAASPSSDISSIHLPSIPLVESSPPEVVLHPPEVVIHPTVDLTIEDRVPPTAGFAAASLLPDILVSPPSLSSSTSVNTHPSLDRQPVFMQRTPRVDWQKQNTRRREVRQLSVSLKLAALFPERFSLAT
ncbi:hypothetical protein C8F01DRAFT_1367524 [Mycena amicta]|nr:hypothetical protein C8F01DRAFT_1367524 [Mycena amicta]